MMRFHTILPALPLALAAMGCDGLNGPGTVGELGQGTFSYQCALSEGDAVCNDAFPDPVNRGTVDAYLGIDGQIPAGIAVNGRFDLTYFGDVTTEDWERLTIVVEPAANENVDEQGGFRIRRPGHYAFMARDRAERVVADFTYLDAYIVGDVKIWMDEQPIESLDLQLGTSSTHAILGATPIFTIEGEDIYLAGALPYEWESADPEILAVDPAHSTDPEPMTNIELNNDEVRVTAVAAGTTTLTVTVGEIVKTLQVTVTQEVTP